MKPRPTAWAWSWPRAIRAPPSHCGRRWARRTVPVHPPVGRLAHQRSAGGVGAGPAAVRAGQRQGPRGPLRRAVRRRWRRRRIVQGNPGRLPRHHAQRLEQGQQRRSARYSSSKACGVLPMASKPIDTRNSLMSASCTLTPMACAMRASAVGACGRERRCRPRSGCRRRNRRSPLARRWARRATARPAAADHGQRLDPALFDQRQGHLRRQEGHVHFVRQYVLQCRRRSAIGHLGQGHAGRARLSITCAGIVPGPHDP